MSLLGHEDVLGQRLYSDDDEDHGEGLRLNIHAIGRALGPTDVYFVSPAFTAANLYNDDAADKRHFSTIQAAINAAQSASVMTGARPTILVYPGSYAERLTGTGTVGIIGLAPQLYYGYGAAKGVTITGDGSANPVITWTPANGVAHSLTLANLCLNNSYAAENPTTLATAYGVVVNAQGTLGSSANRLNILGCEMRMLTSGLHNKWFGGIMASGWNSVLVRDTAITSFRHAGGALDGGVQRTFIINGTNNPANVSSLYVSKSQVYNEYGGAAVPTVFFATQYANVTVTYTAFKLSTSDPVWVDGGAGVQNFYGMKSLAEIADAQNINGTMPFPM